MGPRLYLHQVMGLLLMHLEVVPLPITTQLQAEDLEVEVVVLLQVMVPRLHLRQVTGLPQVGLEVRAFLLQVTQVLAVDSVEVLLLRVMLHLLPLHLVMELQVVEEEAVVGLLLLVTVLLQFLRLVTVLLRLVTVLHQRRLPHMELPQYHQVHTAVPELETLEHHLPAMAHQQHRQADHRRRPETMVPPNLRLLHLLVTEHPQARHHHQEVMQLLQHRRQVTARLLHPVYSLEDFLHKHTRPLATLELLEVALLFRVTESLPDRQAAMVLRMQVPSAVAVLLPVLMVLPVLLVHRLEAMVSHQGQSIRHLLQRTEHPVLLLEHLQRQLKTMELLLYLLEVMGPQHVGRQGHLDISAPRAIYLKEVRRQTVMERQQL